MSRTRDIADILGKSEDVNPNNLKLLKLGDAGGDAANVVNVTVNGSGNSDKIAEDRIEIGDPVVVLANGRVQAVGQPFEPYEVHNDSAGMYGQRIYTGGTVPEGTTNSNGSKGPFCKYLGGNKLLAVCRSGYYIYARILKLNNAGTSIVDQGPRVIIQSQISAGSGNGGARSMDFAIEPGTGYAFIVWNNHEYVYAYNNYFGQRGRCMFVSNDLTDINDLTITTGTNYMWGSTGSSSADPWDSPKVVYDPVLSAVGENHVFTIVAQNQSSNGVLRSLTVEHAPGGGEPFSVGSAGTCRSGSGLANEVRQLIYNKRHNIYTIIAKEDGQYSDYYVASHFHIYNWSSGGGSMSQYYSNIHGYFGSANQSIGYHGAYDSSSGFTVVGYVNSSTDQGKLVTVDWRDRSRGGTIDSAGALNTVYVDEVTFGANCDDIPEVVHLKLSSDNIVIFDDNNSGNKTNIRRFTIDSVGQIDLEDSTHELIDSAFNRDRWEYIDDYDKILWSRYYGTNDARLGTSTYNNVSDIAGDRYGFLFSPERRQITNLTTANYLGISQDSADSGESVQVKLNGAIDTNQFGLVPGTTYYLNELNGNLEPNTDHGSVRAGIATAVGNLKIISVYDSDAS